MYKRLSMVLFPILLVALVGAGVWGYREHQEKNAILIKAENQYQRAFNNLAFHMDELNKQLGNALAVGVNSSQFHRKCLVNVWRITSEAQGEINQLPLALLPFNKTEEFLSNIAKFSYNTAVRDLTKEPLNEQETATLQALYKRSKELSSELRNIQSQALSEQLRWMDVEVEMAMQDVQAPNSIIDGFKTVDQKVTEFSDVDFGPSNVNVYEAHYNRKLDGPTINQKEAKRIAYSFLNLPEDLKSTVVENSKGTEFASYSVTSVDERDESSRLNVDVSKKGGKILYFMNHRNVPSSSLSVADATQRAQRFLTDHEYGNLKPIQYDTYNHTAAITFAALQDEVIIYPKKLVVQVALDNGEITGLQATDYVFENKVREIDAPTISREEARTLLNENFDVQRYELAVIQNDMNEEVLCHEFTGRINGGIYRIFLNSETGMEEKIEHIGAADESAAQG